METDLYFDIRDDQWPIIYRPEYNVNFWGMERLHPFDASKWGHIFQFLVNAGLVSEERVVEPLEASNRDLMVIHTKKYIKSLNCSFNVARIAEIPPLVVVPNYFIQRGYLKPMRYQTGGTILAGKLALDRGWAINIGGGFHHCSSKRGGGFCPYADISLLVAFLFNFYPERITKVLIVDLDAHQGNGYERDFKEDDRVYILDVYNKEIYPFDKAAKQGISRKVELTHQTTDEEYLKKVEKNLNKAFNEFTPEIIVYNAGTDILEGDPLGGLSVSGPGIIQRDELVFRKSRAHNIPIVMLTSGGYLKKTAKIIATSILNLHDKGLIRGPQARY